MKILVCGGRDYSDRNHIMKTLDLLAIRHSREFSLFDNWLPSDIVIIHGGAKGADTWADEWAVVNWIVPEMYKADWDKFGKAAGMIRNKKMLEEGKPDLVVAFPGGRGTQNMVKIAKDAGVAVLESPI